MKLSDIEPLAKGTALQKGKTTVFFRGIEKAGTDANPGNKALVKTSATKTGKTFEYVNPLSLKPVAA